MRQAGYLAAAGVYALENNIERLQDDHQHASDISHALMKKSFIGKLLPVETNIVIFEVIDDYTPATFCERLKQDNILCLPISATQVRMVLHLDVTTAMVQKLIALIGTM